MRSPQAPPHFSPPDLGAVLVCGPLLGVLLLLAGGLSAAAGSSWPQVGTGRGAAAVGPVLGRALG